MSRLPSSSREEWLEQRRHVITATEIAEIASSPAAAKRIREEKRTGRQAFRGNRYTEWGQLEEKFIQKHIQENFDSDIFPNDDLWISDEDDRFAATPDMTYETRHGVKFVVEIKTVLSKNDWGDGAIPKRYADQVQWQLFVTGAERCLFAWEAYEDDNGMFFPSSPICTRWIERDEKRIGQLIDIADAWLAGEDGLRPAPLIQDLLQRRVAVDKQIAELQAESKAITAEIAEELGDDPQSWTYEGLGTVAVTRPSVRKSFDKKRFEKDHPALAKKYMKESQVKGTVRFTPEKDDNKKKAF